MLVLAPVMCILSGIGVSQVLTTYMKNLDVSRPDKKTKKQQDSTYPIKNEVRLSRWNSNYLRFRRWCDAYEMLHLTVYILLCQTFNCIYHVSF